MASTTGMKVDTSDPNVRRLVYNMYRGMLGTYNDKANDIISTLPKEMVREDQGIARQLESMIRQSSQISGGGNTPSPGPPTSGDEITESNTPPSFPAPPPPPPPPPPGPGTLPTVRLNAEIPDSRRGGGGYEPPAAIQNAMMTKDKKPFTYTPGGLDLSQIRSPRMQRRITRNANAEGVSNEPAQAASMKTSPLAQSSPQGPLPPSAVAAMQPQMAVPVFPTGGSGGAPQLHHVNMPPGSHSAPTPPPPPAPVSVEQPPVSNAIPKTITPVIRPVQSSAPKPEPPKISPPVAKVAVPPSPVEVLNEPGSIYVPPVTSRSQVGSLYIPPITNNTQQEVVSPTRQQTPQSASPMSPVPTLNKAPTPWMSQAQRQQQQQNVPSWVAKEESQQPTGATRIIPIQVEGRSEPVQPPQPPPPQVQQQHQAVNQAQARIIPIQIEGSTTATNNTSSQPKQQQRMPVYVHNKFNPPTSPQAPTPSSPAPYNHSESTSDQNPRQYQQQQSWGPSGANGGPIQSRSFKVLQKITDTDNNKSEEEAQEYCPPSSERGQWNTQNVPAQQLHKLQLSEDDRALMNKFKAQVSEETPTNEEENPRYRGGHIPSRVFRMLDESVPRGQAASRSPQMKPSQQASPGDGTPQPYIPPSEQQVQEPRKYTGGAIPSRSFRMLQAMTAPENCGPGQSDM